MSVRKGYAVAYGPLIFAFWTERIEVITVPAGSTAPIDWEALLPLLALIVDTAAVAVRDTIAQLKAVAEAEQDPERKRLLLERIERLEKLAGRLPLISTILKQQV
ncbi:MAG: hypothetical protein QXZ31_05520 [Thermofilaceae archaeon]